MILKVKETRTTIKAPDAVHAMLSRVLGKEDPADRDKEHFWSIALNTRNRIKYVELVSLGILNASLVHPRELFRTAISRAASSLIVAHNHPSGDPDPSDGDLTLTRRISEAGRILGIEVLDHVIISSRSHFTSFKERGLL